jgi:peptidoglycan biosynthesis protein MviN/MurJ (putative lipid II flippase)
MLLSTSMLNSAYNNFPKKEDYNSENKAKCVSCVILAIILLIIELAVLFFAIDIALNTPKSNAEKFIHLVLAVTFTLPYLLLNVLFNEKARELLEKRSR